MRRLGWQIVASCAKGARGTLRGGRKAPTAAHPQRWGGVGGWSVDDVRPSLNVVS